MIVSAEPRKPITVGSIGPLRMPRCMSDTAKWISRRPMNQIKIAPAAFSANVVSIGTVVCIVVMIFSVSMSMVPSSDYSSSRLVFAAGKSGTSPLVGSESKPALV